MSRYKSKEHQEKLKKQGTGISVDNQNQGHIPHSALKAGDVSHKSIVSFPEQRTWVFYDPKKKKETDVQSFWKDHIINPF